jgi:hypothetical protein
MKLSRNQKQHLPDPVKKECRRQKSGQAQAGAAQGAERMAAGAVHARDPAQADGAKEAVVVFGDALAAEELAAFEALRDRLAGRVVQAMLMGQGRHGVS